MQHTNLGFEPKGLYFAGIPFTRDGFVTPASRATFLADYMNRLRAVPGVRGAAVADNGPGARSFSIGRLEVEGEPAPPSTNSAFIDVNDVQSGYFATMRIPLVEGTTFTDTNPASGQVMINAGFARAHWPAGGAVGHRIRVAQNGDEAWKTIVGVVGDAATGGPNYVSGAPMLYSPAGDMTRPTILLRTDGDAKALAPAISLLKSMGIKRVSELSSVEQRVANSIAPSRYIMIVLTLFTTLGLVLASIGLYGVMAYSVAQETREIGIRVALGATSGRIGRAVLTRGLRLATLGAALGLAGSVWGTKLIERELYGVGRSDPLSLAAGGLLLVMVALVACLVPARRALAVDPMTAIRAD
jgi:predicted permease